MKIYHFLMLIISIGVLSSCLPEFEKEYQGTGFDFSDTDLQSVYRLAANGDVDSLKTYIAHDNPAIRRAVAQIASDGEQKALLPHLYPLLNDENVEVSTLAAYAIGQYKDPSSISHLTKAYDSNDSLRLKKGHNAAILEAFGKIGDNSIRDNIVGISSFGSRDTTLLLGQMRALQYFAGRKMLNGKAIELILDKIADKNIPMNVKIVAANILGRAKELPISKYEQRIFNLFEKTNNPFVRMALIKSLKTTKNFAIQKGIIDNLGNYDPRVTINTLSSIGDFPYNLTVTKVMPLLQKNKNQQVALAAVNYIKYHGLSGSNSQVYNRYLSSITTPETQIALRGAILNRLPRGFANSRKVYSQQLQSIVTDSAGIYNKIEATRALANDPDNYPFLLSQIKEGNGLVSSAAAESLSTMMTSDRFAQFFRNGTEYVKKQIVDSLKTKIALQDAGVTSIIGNLFIDKKLNLKPYLGDGQYLKTEIAKLNLPKDLEPYDALQKALAHIENKKYTPKPYQSKAINWDVLAKVGNSVKAEFVSDKGTFVAELYPQRAPHSVSNFIELANEGYFNGKKIHRVVPNFVIQSGCARGDGYSSLDYTIRSEVAQSYYEDEGYLGMASLGYNTESSQWFVTHSPTIHLNGRYTIFGKVISGMDVVMAANIGDEIKEIIIKK